MKNLIEKLKISKEKPCPHCHELVNLKDLKRKPAKWYEWVNENDNLICPKCGGLVINTIQSSKWFYFGLVPLYFMGAVFSSNYSGIFLFIAHLVITFSWMYFCMIKMNQDAKLIKKEKS